jgi:protein gp37
MLTRQRLWGLVEQTPNLDWLLLTKRPQFILGMVPGHWRCKFPPNVWVGTSVESQDWADERVKHLLQVPAVVRFLSCEPLLGGVNLTSIESFTEERINALAVKNGINWVIAGGESGRNARQSQVRWYEDLQAQCKAHGVAFFMKQLGSQPRSLLLPVALNDRNGGDMSEWPEALRVQEMPNV